ncbi:heat shock protein 30 [Fomitopsis serialis]|uniref:heat shock protein 30 n=1 Tax=Fomitopsis serialis TaxID=139415 RepID=UPI002008DB08|nr:heat shock protein 30 [Neoantrodia serialis]KAH9926169.1 heat shock protein 30 [Neoantrodia serialis]
MGGNRALQLNPPNADLHISTHASDWLWSAFSVFGLSLLVMVGLDLLRARGTRLFHQLAIIILATFTLGYYSMASDLGATPIAVEFRGRGSYPTRQIWYVRYIQWFITFPLLVLEVLLATGLSLSDIVTTLFMCIVVVISGLVGALVHSTYKWGYFSFGCAALIYVWYSLLIHGTRTAFPGGGVLRTGYLRSASFLSFMLITYPICWACSEGGNVISNSSEMIWYGILDIIAGPVFLFFYLWHLMDVDYATFGFASGKYTDTEPAAAAPSAPVGEKSAPPA